MPLFLKKVFFAGNLTRDPETQNTAGGKSVCTFSIAISNNKKGDEQETEYYNCVCFGKTAEFVQQYVKKGCNIYFEGRAKRDTWEDKTTGKGREKISFIADHVSLLSSPKNKDGESGQEQPQGEKRKYYPRADAVPPRVPPPVDEDVDGEDIPF